MVNLPRADGNNPLVIGDPFVNSCVNETPLHVGALCSIGVNKNTVRRGSFCFQVISTPRDEREFSSRPRFKKYLASTVKRIAYSRCLPIK